MIADRFRLKNSLRSALKIKKNHASETAIQRVQLQIEKSLALADVRLKSLPETTYPQSLPVSYKRQEIADAICSHQVVIVAGETGSGKTTQIPKICLDAGRGIVGKIGHTQPRRLAARTVAARLAEELNVTLGDQVGYQIRFSDQSSNLTHIKLMTDGILLAETQRDRFLSGYDTLIIDEAHERSLNIDFLLGYLKQLLPRRPDLKVIITSATIDLDRFSSHFGNAPVIEVSGRTYPVEVIYQPGNEKQDNNKASKGIPIDGPDGLPGNILAAVDRIRALPGHTGANDILVFLSGEKEIRDVSKLLRHQHYRHTEILPLYARLSNAEQNRVFQLHTGQRIILATNVAETSITVPGIRYVIDSGLARISRYSIRSKVQQLPVEPISRASANQRKGRCGRLSDGVCIRLYSEEDFNNRPEFTDPEILRTNLASVILQMLHLRLGDIDAFPFIERPHSRSIKDGYQLLLELGAVNQGKRITKLGRQLARFPLDPRIARMLVAAREYNCLHEILIIASALAIQDPRERPHNKQQAADQKHRIYADDDSDFMGLVNLWHGIEGQRQKLSQNQFRKFCRNNFLSYPRVREWRETHRQLMLLCRELALIQNSKPAGFSGIHRAILTGLLGYIGEKHDTHEYQGTRNRRFYIFPGSALFKKSPKWIVAFELVETTRLFARMAARIDATWIEPLAGELVRKNYFEPHWQKKRGQVIAFEQVSLYGLVIVNRRRIDYGKINPVEAREIFIRSALVEGMLDSKISFYTANQDLISKIEALENKSRRRDILIDDESIYRFYDDRIPGDVNSLSTLSRWLKKTKQDDRLYLTREYLMQSCASRVSETQFPNQWCFDDTCLPLSYEFSPGSASDGVTLGVPLSMLNRIPGKRLQWLVPGMLRDKCIALVKALPKPVRKNFVPVPGFVDQALMQMSPCDKSLTHCLGLALKRLTGVEILPRQWNVSSLDSFHLMNICVTDEKGDVVAQGRNLVRLRKRLSQNVRDLMDQVNQETIERDNISRWDFGSLDREITVNQAGVTMTAYPALVEKEGTLALKMADTRSKAQRLSRSGVLRLFMLATPKQKKQLIRQISELPRISLYFARLGSMQELLDDLLRLIYRRTFLDEGTLPVNQDEFDQLLRSRKGQLISIANETIEQVYSVLTQRHSIAGQIPDKIPSVTLFVYDDINKQLGHLFDAGFIVNVPWQQLMSYPRYLKALELRLEKIQGQLQKEKTCIQQLQDYWQRYETLRRNYRDQALDETPLERLRWLFEEYRVSLYAQVLGTSEPVSSKRIEKLFSQLGS